MRSLSITLCHDISLVPPLYRLFHFPSMGDCGSHLHSSANSGCSGNFVGEASPLRPGKSVNCPSQTFYGLVKHTVGAPGQLEI